MGRTRRRRWLQKAAVLLATMVSLAIALEVGVRAFVGEEVFSFEPVFRADPVVGYTLKPGHEEYAFGAMVRSNSAGFRGPEWSLAKPAGTFRIALLGDSHAFGFGVPFEDSVGAVLERQIAERTGRPCQVLNFAQPGYTARQELAVLKAHALRYDPDLVIVVLCDNDHRDDLWVDRQGWLRWGEPEPEPDPDTVIEGLWKPNRRWGLLAESRALAWLKILWHRMRIADRAAQQPPRPGAWLRPVAPGPFRDELRQRVYDPFAEIAAICGGRGIPVVYAAHAIDPDYRRLLASLGEATGAPTLELLALFPDTTSWPDLLDKYSLGWDPHFGPEAHRRWAEALFDLLQQRDLLPRPAGAGR